MIEVLVVVTVLAVVLGVIGWAVRDSLRMHDPFDADEAADDVRWWKGGMA